MSGTGPRPRLVISHGPKKKIHPEPDPHLGLGVGGNLTPDVQPDTLPPSFTSPGDVKQQENVLKLGKYILFKQNEKLDYYHALDTATQEELTCKVVGREGFREALSPYWQVDDHQHVAACREMVLGATRAYVFFPRHHGDLHSYVRGKKRLREAEAVNLFSQVVQAIVHCHGNGVVLRDLKLRKFVFQDPERTKLQLEGLEDAVVLEEDADDVLRDKHGCPAYVSPEILSASQTGYSGKAADVWSLGVMLYTMLVGRYPFHDPQPLALFGKIRRGHFQLPEGLSPKAKCLIRCLLRRDPAERLAAADILSHPWFQAVPSLRRLPNPHHSKLQVVPDLGSSSLLVVGSSGSSAPAAASAAAGVPDDVPLQASASLLSLSQAGLWQG